MLHWLPEELWQRVSARRSPCRTTSTECLAPAPCACSTAASRVFSWASTRTAAGRPFHATDGLLVEDARRPPDVRLAGRLLPRGLRIFRAGGMAARAGAARRDTRYRPPRAGDFLRHRRGFGRAGARASAWSGSAHGARRLSAPRLIVSITNQWRMDNDPPLPALGRFRRRLESAGPEARRCG